MSDEVYRHMWGDPKKLDDPAVLKAALIESKLPADKLFDWAQTGGGQGRALAGTTRAVERGTFGSPTFFVDDDIYFGKDACAMSRKAIPPRNKPEAVPGITNAGYGSTVIPSAARDLSCGLKGPSLRSG